jgi:hypothetical protein
MRQWSICQYEDRYICLLSPTEMDRRQLSELHDGILTAIVEYDMHCTYMDSHFYTTEGFTSITVDCIHDRCCAIKGLQSIDGQRGQSS